MSELPNDLPAIRAANAERRRVKERASKGPWYVHNVDDEACMNAWAVTTSQRDPDVEPCEQTNSHKEIVALTLLQSPRVVCHADDKWQENAEFIVAAKNDPVEDVVDALCEEVERLRTELEKVRAGR